MKKENIGIEIAQSLEKYLVRAERFNEVLLKNLAKLEVQKEGMVETLPKVTLEVEELKKTREKLPSFLAEKIREAYLLESKAFNERLLTSFLEKVDKELKVPLQKIRDQIQREKNDLKRDLEKCAAQARETNEKYMEYADKFRNDMEKTASTLKQLLNLQKQRLTYKGLLICLVFCGASVLTGSGLFYFFPQKVYYQDMNTAKNILMGRVTWESFNKLSPKDQDILVEGVKKYMLVKN
jgi:gas vesicle protein